MRQRPHLQDAGNSTDIWIALHDGKPASPSLRRKQGFYSSDLCIVWIRSAAEGNVPAVLTENDPATFVARAADRSHGLSMHVRRAMSKQARPSFDDVSESRRVNMAAIRGRNTGPELVVRRLLHSLGYRFRLHRMDLPGRPDIVLPGRRAVIDVRGCFWHRHSDPLCTNAILPKTRREWWAAKLGRNTERDAANVAALRTAGWKVLILWECEVRRNRPILVELLTNFLGRPGSSSSPKGGSRTTRKNRPNCHSEHEGRGQPDGRE